MENLEKNINQDLEKAKFEGGEINLADLAVQEAIDRIKQNLKEKQEKSQDEFFKKLEIDKLTLEALMILNASLEEFEEPFPKSAKSEVVRNALESPLYPETFHGPKDRLAYIKELIVLYPNHFYKREFEK